MGRHAVRVKSTCNVSKLHSTCYMCEVSAGSDPWTAYQQQIGGEGGRMSPGATSVIQELCKTRKTPTDAPRCHCFIII